MRAYSESGSAETWCRKKKINTTNSTPDRIILSYIFSPSRPQHFIELGDKHKSEGPLAASLSFAGFSNKDQNI